MADNTLTIVLNGDVPLDAFTTTMRHFSALVEVLSRHIAGKTKIEWVIEDLSGGSASATIIGISERMDIVDSIVYAYTEIGKSLERGFPIPYSGRIKNEAVALTTVLNGRITSINFITARGEANIVSHAGEGQQSPPIQYSLGVLKGTVETLTKRGNLRFTLYDDLFDKAVTCYLEKGQEEQMRDIWGKRVIVSGSIGREPAQGRAVVMREIFDIVPQKEVDPDSYKLARGILAGIFGDERSEDLIRRVRDAE